MRIFVAGATGAVGRVLVPALVAAGHTVTGMTRSPDKAAAIRRAGAEPVVADGLNARAVRAAVISARPDVIIDQMTDSPPSRICGISTEPSPTPTACAPRERTICSPPRTKQR